MVQMRYRPLNARNFLRKASDRGGGGVGGAIPATVLARGRTILPRTNHNYSIYSKYVGFVLSLLYLSINLNKLVLLPADVSLTDGLVANTVDQKCGIRSLSTFFLTHSIQILRVSTVFVMCT